MMLYSTTKKSPPVSLRDAVMKGLADDNGLYMPETIPLMPDSFFKTIGEKSFAEISFQAARTLLQGSVPDGVLKKIVDDAVNFDSPLVKVQEDVYSLELFHGPTHAFKDFGARFMSRLMAHFIRGSGQELNILVATSGDTGSAVASGFFDTPGIRVYILYPSGKVSDIQEKQLTTWGKNITAIEVNGTFDDCQKMVKQVFLDTEITAKKILSSANSINIARLVPQTFYYFYAYSQLRDKSKPVVFSVPSGNFGNLTAGLMAAEMGLPVSKFIASTNMNDIVPKYLSSGIFNPLPSKSTISNAMDVGNPSNFARMNELFHGSVEEMKNKISGYAFTDEETKSAMKKVYSEQGYVMDPHGAVGYLGLQTYRNESKDKFSGIFLETAHPAKFLDVVESTLGIKVDIPSNLKASMEKEKKLIKMANRYEDFKSYLLSA